MRALEHVAEPEAIVTRAPDRSPLALDDDTVAELLTAIQRAVRRTLRVSLRDGDGSQRNQDALELVNDAWLKLQTRLIDGAAVQDARVYAFLTAKTLCFDYLRRLSVQHRSMRDSALRFLRVTAGFAAWKVDERWLTGFDRWQAEDRHAFSREGLRQLLASKESLYDPDNSRLNWTAYQRRAWRRLFHRVFSVANAPLWLDDLIAVIVAITNAAEPKRVEVDLIDSQRPSPDVHLDSREELKATWQEIAALPRQQRLALLLNSIDGGLDQLVFSGVATLQDLAATLRLTRGEFAVLQRAIPAFGAELGEAGPLTLDEQFAALWRHVPMADDAIAALLGLTRQEVVNRRVAARQRLRRRLAGTFGGRRQKRRREAGAGPSRELPSARWGVYTLGEATSRAQSSNGGRTGGISPQTSRSTGAVENLESPQDLYVVPSGTLP